MRTHPLLPFGLVLALGCGGEPKVAPVSGTVTMDGKALANAAVSFQPTGDRLNLGVGSSGRTNEKGEYTLELIGGAGRGAVVGPHRVEINPAVEGNPDDERRPPPKVRIPPRYNRRSELTFEVKPGGNTANFDLTSN